MTWMSGKRSTRKRTGKSKETKNKIRGYKSALKGLDFERKVMEYFSKKGYTVKSRKKTKTYGEADIIAYKKGTWFTPDEYIFIECKNKEKIPLSDFVKFIDKFKRFRNTRREAKVLGYFIYKGNLDPKIKTTYRNLEENLRKTIKIKKF